MYVLDASALLRYLDGEEGVYRMREIIKSHVNLESHILISAVNWGEVVGTLIKRGDSGAASATLRELRDLSLQIVPATAQRCERAAQIKAIHSIPYADAFGVELAGDSRDHVLVTADFDVRPAENAIRIEFLPAKAKR